MINVTTLESRAGNIERAHSKTKTCEDFDGYSHYVDIGLIEGRDCAKNG
jgi:hypothetical protein